MILAVALVNTPIASAIAAPPDLLGQPAKAEAGVRQPTEPLVAREGDASAMRLHVGDTGIKCLRLPCPSRGVFLPRGPLDEQRGGLLYTDRDGHSPPPPMIGKDAMLAAVTTAWNERQCLAIDGRLISGVEDRPVLRIDRIVGRCRDTRK